MANKTISQLPAATIAANAKFAIDQDGVTKYLPRMLLRTTALELVDVGAVDTTGVAAVNSVFSSAFDLCTTYGIRRLILPRGTIKITAQLTLSIAGLTIEGAGPSETTLLVDGTELNAFYLNADNITIRGLKVQCCGSSGSYAQYNGAAVYGASQSGITLEDLLITNHRGWGIVLVNSSDISIRRVRTESANAPTAPQHSEMYADIGLIGSTERATISECTLLAEQAFPILVQSIANTPGTITDLDIVGNYVYRARGHGISLYGQNGIDASGGQMGGTGQDTWQRNIVRNNRIYDTRGSLLEYGTGNKPWGAGIYIQNASRTLVSGNTVYGAAAETSIELLAPAGIGVVNCRDFTVSNNFVNASTQFGFYYSNANNGGVTGEHGLSEGNRAVSCTKPGFKVNSCVEVLLIGDISVKNGSHGFELRDNYGRGSYRLRSCVAQYNSLDGFTTAGSGIPKVMFEHCDANNNTQHGFGIGNSTVSRLYVIGCRAYSNSVRGYNIGTSVTVEQWSQNYATVNQTNFLLNSALPGSGEHYDTGSPEGAVLANVGCVYRRTDGGTGTTLYIKESGAGTNTGWVAK